MNLPRKRPKPAKEGSRWKSQAHLTHVRQHECAMCFADAPIEAAHVRLGTDGGMSRKPSDFYAVPLCKDCHQRQHTIGEDTFWQEYRMKHGLSVQALMEAMWRKSPRVAQIRATLRERGL